MTMPAQGNRCELPPTVPYGGGISNSSTAASKVPGRRWLVVGAVLLAVIVGLVSALIWVKWETADSQTGMKQTAGGARVPTEFRLGESFPSAGLIPMTVRGSDEKVYLHSRPLLTSYHIASAQVGISEYGPQIHLQLTDIGREILAQVTESNVGKPLGIVIGQELLSAPIISAPILTGRVSISGNFTEAEARRLAADIAGR